MKNFDSKYELLYPPKGIFLNEQAATWDWTPKDLGLSNSSTIDWPSEGGILYCPKNQRFGFPGFPFPPAIDNTAIFKRFIINKLYRPWRLIFWKEIDELMLVSVERYFLKPDMYCRAVREMYRLGKLLYPEEGIWDRRIHAVCSIFQWDPAYRFRVQMALARLRKNLGVRKGINEILDFMEAGDNNVAVKAKYRKAKLLFNILLYWPPFYRKVKIVFDNLRNDKMALTEADRAFAFADVQVHYKKVETK